MGVDVGVGVGVDVAGGGEGGGEAEVFGLLVVSVEGVSVDIGMVTSLMVNWVCRGLCERSGGRGLRLYRQRMRRWECYSNARPAQVTGWVEDLCMCLYIFVN